MGAQALSAVCCATPLPLVESGMARLLGTTWASYVGEGPSSRVVAPAAGALAIEHVARELTTQLDGKTPAPVKAGRIVRFGKALETAIYCDRSWTEGALVSIRCKETDTAVRITVGRTSALLRASVYLVLGLGVVAGLLVAREFLPATWDTTPRFLAGLFLGVAAAVPFLLALGRVPGLAGGRSEETRKELERNVQEWLDQANTTDALSS